jgi:hypothetical protein
VTVWTLANGAVSGTANIANPGLNWRIAGVGDQNGDGKADILLQHTDGSVAQWLMDGANIAGATVVANPGAEWQVV